MNKIAKGYTFYISIGKYAGFFFNWDKGNKRIVLGNISIALIKCDIEVLVDKLMNKLKERGDNE